jgi:arsenate reductase (glutaredoxin)
MEMWNNPACSKCAAVRETLDGLGVPVKLRPYLDEPPTAAELTAVLSRLGAQPWEICRTGEPIAQELGLDGWAREESTRERWIEAMVTHPQLIQRPIVLLDDGSAVVARTPEALTDLATKLST